MEPFRFRLGNRQTVTRIYKSHSKSISRETQDQDREKLLLRDPTATEQPSRNNWWISGVHEHWTPSKQANKKEETPLSRPSYKDRFLS